MSFVWPHLVLLLLNLIFVGVAASDRDAWEFRLAGGTEFDGRVEMRPNNTAPWGTICVDMFKESNYGPLAACNSVGLVGMLAYFTPNYAPGDFNSPIYLTNVDCQPGQQFLQNCSTSELLAVGHCVHWEDVGVVCYLDTTFAPRTTTTAPPVATPDMWQFGLINGTAPSNGIFAMKPTPSLPWGSVYYWYILHNIKLIELACAAVGYNLTMTKEGRSVMKSSPYVFSRTPMAETFITYYYPMYCAVDATDIRECPYMYSSSYSSSSEYYWDPYSESIYLDCRPPEASKVPTIEVRLTNPWPGWRLGVGNVEIRDPAVNTAWSNICAEAITYAGAAPNWDTPAITFTDNMKAICASAGFPGAKTPMFRKYGSSSAVIRNDNPRTYDYYADTMNCTGATLLSDCYIYAPAGNYYCGWNLFFAGIDCYSEPENRTEWEYRLWEGTNGLGNGVTSGVFQMRSTPTAPWASASTNGEVAAWNVAVWNAICRTLGISINSTSYLAGKPYGLGKSYSYYGNSGNTSYWTSVSWCSSDDSTLFQDCSLTPLGSFGTSSPVYEMAIDCNPPIYDPSQWEFRLVGSGNLTGSGFVEFKPLPGLDFGYIGYYYDDPSNYNLKAICHSLGFLNVEKPTVGWFGDAFFNNSAPIYFQSMSCANSHLYVQNCSFSYGIGYVDPGTHVYVYGVVCYPKPPPPPPPPPPLWRLTDGDAPWRGRIVYNFVPWGTNLWGTICNDYFKNNYIAWNAACHSAGYLNVTGARYKSYGPGPNDWYILWDNIQCKKGDFYIENCTKRSITETRLPIAQHNCFHGQDAGVDCYPPEDFDRKDLWEFRLQDGTAASNGRLEMRPTSAATWGTVCSDPFNHSHFAWLAACRLTGYPNVQRAAWAYFGRGSDTIYLDNVLCFANSTTLKNFSTDPVNSFFCTPWDAAGVDCDPPPETPGLWQFRLTGGNTASNGLLEMRPATTSEWGNVCRNGLYNSRIALLAICKTFGFTAVRPVARFFGKGLGVIYLDNATCAPGTDILDQCSFNPLYSHACTHDMDMGIECFPSATASLTLSKTETHTKSFSCSITGSGGFCPKIETPTTPTQATPATLTQPFETRSPSTPTQMRALQLTRTNTSMRQPTKPNSQDRSKPITVTSWLFVTKSDSIRPFLHSRSTHRGASSVAPSFLVTKSDSPILHSRSTTETISTSMSAIKSDSINSVVGTTDDSENTVKIIGGAIGIVSGSIALPIGTMQQQIAFALLRMASCQEGGLDGQQLDLATHPLYFSVGSGHSMYARGAVIGNLIIIPIIWCVMGYFVAPFVIGRAKGVSVESARDFVGWPSMALTPIAVLSEGSTMASVGLVATGGVANIAIGAIGLVLVSIFLAFWARSLWQMRSYRGGALKSVRMGHQGLKWLIQPMYEWILASKAEKSKIATERDGSEALKQMTPADVAYLDKRLAFICNSWWLCAALATCILVVITGVAEGIPISCKVRWVIAASAAVLQFAIIVTLTIPIENILLGIVGLLTSALIVIITLTTFGVIERSQDIEDALEDINIVNTVLNCLLMLVGLLVSKLQTLMEYFRRKHVRDVEYRNFELSQSDFSNDLLTKRAEMDDIELDTKLVGVDSLQVPHIKLEIEDDATALPHVQFEL